MSTIDLAFSGDQEILYLNGDRHTVQPIGTFACDILNTDFKQIKKEMEDNRPSFAFPDRFPAILRKWEKSHVFQFLFYDDDWSFVYQFLYSEITNHVNDEFYDFQNVIDRFKVFLVELNSRPCFFSFDFLVFLNANGMMQPFEADPCSTLGSERPTREVLPVEKMYDMFLAEGRNNKIEYRYRLDIMRGFMYSVLPCTIIELARAGKVLKPCRNCGRYFVPANRSDTLYCDNPSPVDPALSCREYGTRRLWYERQKEDELASLSRKIASAKGMLAKRNPDIPQYAESYEYFKAQRLIWIKAVKEGTRTQEEYKEWLLSMQSQKIIKEAAHGND